MPFVDNNGVKIYYEVEGEGVPLMLHHPLYGNLKLFRHFNYTERTTLNRMRKNKKPDAFKILISCLLSLRTKDRN